MAQMFLLTCKALDSDIAKLRKVTSTQELYTLLGRAGARARLQIKTKIGEIISSKYTIDSADAETVTTMKSGWEGTALCLTFSGRVLTLKHFQFTTGHPITATVIRGSSRTLGLDTDGGAVFMPKSGSKLLGLANVPWVRFGTRRQIQPVKRLSVPQMIGSPTLSDKIQSAAEKIMMKEVDALWNSGSK